MPTNPAVSSIRRWSVALAWACLLGAVLLPLLVLGWWSSADAQALAGKAHLRADAVWGDLQAWQRLAGGLVAVLPALLASWGLWQARQCFGGFARGDLFTDGAVRYLRRFAACMGGSALAAVAAGPALSVLLTWNNPPGLRHLAVGIGSDQLLLLLFAGMVWLMAAVIGQGQALAEENASFV